ncbi:hypothetical protein [Streptomyces sp. NPDC048349]|uniref:phthiocerol/phthiodiolone dimycocerosyl transferase family protein n=1 Tax=Streptomyces sp. NPDC048349 TaxID=3155486 RepID=UPI00341261BE
MTTSAVIRPLAPSEETFARAGVYMGYAVRVSGSLDVAALAAAYQAVVRAHPVLGARLEPADGEGFDLVAASAGTPGITVVDGDEDQLVHGPEFDQRTVLSHVSVVRDGDTADVTLFTHHSIADACHSLAVLAELWSCYTDVVTGRSPEREVRPYPVPVEELLAQRGIEKRAWPVPAGPQAAEQAAVEPVVAPPAVAAAPVGGGRHVPPLVARCHLSVDETAALVELGHREGVTINGLVSAAILLSDAEIRGLPLTEMIYLYPVDLRTRLTPAVGTTDGTNLLGAARYLPAAGTTGLVELGRSICASLAAAIAEGVVQQTPLHVPEKSTAGVTPPPGMLLVTNWGRVPAPRMPRGLRATDFRSVLTSAPGPHHPSGGACVISTFGGRLSIEIHHTEAVAPQQRQRADSISARLRGALAQLDPPR